MKVECIWNEKLVFTSKADEHQIQMDAKPPLGNNQAMTPKQLVLAGLCGCTAMDVISLMKKYRQPVEQFNVTADARMTEGSYPVTFKEIHLFFHLNGAVAPERLIEAVKLSQTKYCGVSATISKAVPIHYSIELNGKEIATGDARFD